MPTTYAIPDGRTVMAATTYTGNGTSQTITNAGGFAPDLVWIKGRSYVDSHTLFDTVRGATQSLSSNTTTAEVTRTTALTAFTSTGFTVSSDTLVNYNANTLVGWQWKAGGTAVSNTAGSITSQVSANTTAGFSVATYTGTGANATVGHGLGVAPSMAIIKRRSTSGSNWLVYHVSMTATSAVYLNTTEAKQTFSDIWNNTAPTSTVMSLGTTDNCNLNGGTYVGYFFAAVAGYSAFGSYTGNGSTDGPFVYTGFRPRFILVKTYTTTQSWQMYDSARDTYNQVTNTLFANGSNAEASNNGKFDFLSNGFKMRDGDFATNKSGESYIYMAFAENPFKYANAR